MKTKTPYYIFGFILPMGLWPVAHAVTKTWDGGAATLNWSDGANWAPDGVPTSSDAVILDNGSVNPLPTINVASDASLGTLTLNGACASTFMSYGGSTPRVRSLFGSSLNAANTGPLILVGPNAPATVTANKISFQLRTNGTFQIDAGKTLVFGNSFITESGARALTKTGAGTISFSGSGSLVNFSGGLNLEQGTWNAGNDMENLPVAGTITFTNAAGTAATLTSTNSHNIAALAGGNSSSEVYCTGSGGLSITGSSTTTFSGRIRGATKLNHNGTGKLTLNGSNTYTGATTINGGTLALGSGGSISGSPSLSIAAGATFDVAALASGFSLGSGKSVSGSGAITGRLIAASGSVVSPGLAGPGTLTISNGFTLASGANLDFDLNGLAAHDSIVVSGGNVSIAGGLAGTTLGYSPAIGDTLYLIRNNGAGTTTGTLGGVADGGKLDIGGKWFRVSFTSDSGGAGFAIGGTGNDVAIRRIDDPTPTAVALGITGPAETASVQLQLTWADNATNETGYRVYRLLGDGTLELVATLPAGSTGFSASGANQSTHTYAVQAFNGSATLGDLVYAPPFTAGTTYAFRQDAMLDWIAAEVPNLTQFGGGPHRIGRTGFFHGGARIMRGENATGLNYITTAIEDASAENSNAGFSMWPGMDAWMRWNHLFPQSLKDRFQQVYTTSDLYDNGSTPNQRFMVTTASYLANSVWGSAVNSVSSAAYGTGDASGKAHVVTEIERVPFNGFAEHDSKNYLLATLSPMETLAQYAPDADVRNKARMVVDWGVANAAGYWFNGHWGVSASRYATAGRQNVSDDTAQLWWLLFGAPGSGVFDSQANLPFLTSGFPGMLPEIGTVARERQSSFRRRTLAMRRVNGVDTAYFKQAWLTPRHTLWSQVEGAVTYNADGSINLTTLDTNYIQDGYQGERWAVAWDSPPGNDAKLHITSPTTYGGTTDGISIWEDTLQHEDTMIAVYNMPVGGGGSTGNNGNWANEILTGHIPAGYQAITDESATTGRVFLHYDSVLIALYLNRTFAWATDFTINGVNKAALAIETAAVDEYPQSTAQARLAAFRAEVLAVAPNAANVNAAAPRFVYTNRNGHVLDLTFGLAGKINGVTVDYQSWPMIEDPWMYQNQRGHLHILGNNRVVTNNYFQWNQAINNRPVISTASSVEANVGQSVDINLADRTSDGETPDNQLHFTVSNPSNGTVMLLPDGRTARFTPNAAGAASFDVTARDRGLHPKLIWHRDFELPADLGTGSIPDAGGSNRSAAAQSASSGTASLVADSPSSLGGNSLRSIRLNNVGSTGMRLSNTTPRSVVEMSNGSWTFSTWFKRATKTTDDFIFYLGGGDGFSGGGDELYLYCPANSDTVRLSHYSASNVLDVNLISPSTAPLNQWHHVAVTFEKIADHTGTVRIYLNGTLAGTQTNLTWALQQNQPIHLGGHIGISGTAVGRYFDGWLDDSALIRGALSGPEVDSLAKQSIATFGGLAIAETLSVSVAASPWESWRIANFSSALLAVPADTGPLADKDKDGLVNLMEYATATDPEQPSQVPVSIQKNAGFIEFTYKRNKDATDLIYLVKWSDTLAPDSWSTVGIPDQNPPPIAEDSQTRTLRVRVPAGAGKRFVRLDVSNP